MTGVAWPGRQWDGRGPWRAPSRAAEPLAVALPGSVARAPQPPVGTVGADPFPPPPVPACAAASGCACCPPCWGTRSWSAAWSSRATGSRTARCDEAPQQQRACLTCTHTSTARARGRPMAGPWSQQVPRAASHTRAHAHTHDTPLLQRTQHVTAPTHPRRPAPSGTPGLHGLLQQVTGPHPLRERPVGDHDGARRSGGQARGACCGHERVRG